MVAGGRDGRPRIRNWNFREREYHLQAQGSGGCGGHRGAGREVLGGAGRMARGGVGWGLARSTQGSGPSGSGDRGSRLGWECWMLQPTE